MEEELDLNFEFSPAALRDLEGGLLERYLPSVPSLARTARSCGYTSQRIRIRVSVEPKLDLLDEVCDVRSVYTLDADGPLVGMVHWHTTRTVIGINRDGDVAVNDRTVYADSLELATPVDSQE